MEVPYETKLVLHASVHTKEKHKLQKQQQQQKHGKDDNGAATTKATPIPETKIHSIHLRKLLTRRMGKRKRDARGNDDSEQSSPWLHGIVTRIRVQFECLKSALCSVRMQSCQSSSGAGREGGSK